LNQLMMSLVASLLVVSSVFSFTPQAEQTVILISFDGFRWDYPERAETPHFDFLVENGVRAAGLIPSFPTKTFPNHYTIVTGLYPDHHGIVANSMHDRGTDKRFRISDRQAVQSSFWWGGEPIWVTAEKQGIIAASYFWVGSEAPIAGRQPTYWFQYDGSTPNRERIDQVLNWLALPEKERPRLILLYFSLTDDMGHGYGPESVQVAEAVATADSLLGYLSAGLRKAGLFENTNLIVTSDHGMAATSQERVIFLDDYLDLKTVSVVDWSPVAMINPKTLEAESIVEKLKGAHPRLNVFLKSELPRNLHFGEHERIPDVVAYADAGWSISSRAYFDKNPERLDGGTHGYSPEAQSMHAIFIAKGPAFRSDVRFPAFANIHVYELLAAVLGIKPAANDGALSAVERMLK